MDADSGKVILRREKYRQNLLNDSEENSPRSSLFQRVLDFGSADDELPMGKPQGFGLQMIHFRSSNDQEMKSK